MCVISQSITSRNSVAFLLSCDEVGLKDPDSYLLDSGINIEFPGAFDVIITRRHEFFNLRDKIFYICLTAPGRVRFAIVCRHPMSASAKTPDRR